jgi:hypothetical protein
VDGAEGADEDPGAEDPEDRFSGSPKGFLAFLGVGTGTEVSLSSLGLFETSGGVGLTSLPLPVGVVGSAGTVGGGGEERGCGGGGEGAKGAGSSLPTILGARKRVPRTTAIPRSPRRRRVVERGARFLFSSGGLASAFFFPKEGSRNLNLGRGGSLFTGAASGATFF